MLTVIAYLMIQFTPAPSPPPVPPPAPIVVPAAVPVPVVVPVATTTTLPPAVPGPQPVGPSVTVQVTECEVTWTSTQTNPVNGQVGTSTQSWSTDCADAQAFAAQNPGATISPMTFSQGMAAP
jgi:hypothetical protein